ncbi:trichoplein keratin filament-binding protein-like [Hibiscus syriacus]|uniref:trichoplein keratin filament-binding protein-like n=1 Tax=Hibiscus syriacus TaxID=106335 RepID=UPI0019240295|nr:trichoplein keratin filament-binding protein-like [Hibiscus syriacus]
MYKCGEHDWVPFSGIYGSVGYAPLMVSRQYGSRQFIPATSGLSESEFAIRSDQYKEKIRKVVEAWKWIHRVNLFTLSQKLSLEYEQWRINLINDKIRVVNSENVQPIKEHLRIIMSPLMLTKQDFEIERKHWRKTMQKLEEIEIDIHKGRADQIAEGSSKQESTGLKRKSEEGKEELKQRKHQTKMLAKEKEALEKRLLENQAQNHRLKSKIEELETALQNQESNSEAKNLRKQVNELETKVQDLQRRANQLPIFPYEGILQ